MHRQRAAAATTVIAALAAALALGGCAPNQTEPQTFSSISLAPNQRSLGSLISASKAKHADTELSAAATATDFTYTTLAPNGSPTASTAGLYVPKGTPPDGGWPVTIFGHGTTGVTPRCAPTLDTGMFQNLPPVMDLLTKVHAAVVVPNYLGLGSAGHHPYLVSQSHGYDLLGAALAARKIDANIGTRTVMYGISQGARATEAAVELAPTAAPELRIVGNAMAVPALRLEFPAAIAAGTLTQDQYSIMPQLVWGAQSQFPAVTPSSALRGTLGANASKILDRCSGQQPPLWIDPDSSPIGPDDVRPPNPAVARDLTAYFDENQLPKIPNRAVPALVINGRDDTVVTSGWTQTAVDELCAAGVTVEHRPRSGGHYGPGDIDALRLWVSDRLNGKPVRSTCR